jgi:hypothetical protein
MNESFCRVDISRIVGDIREGADSYHLNGNPSKAIKSHTY